MTEQKSRYSRCKTAAFLLYSAINALIFTFAAIHRPSTVLTPIFEIFAIGLSIYSVLKGTEVIVNIVLDWRASHTGDSHHD